VKLTKPKRSRKPAERLILAEKLQQWCLKNRITGNPYMERLIEGLKKRRNLAMLSEIDALDHFPKFGSAVSSRKTKLILTLTVIRNVAVFVPVALTWSAVSHATAGFAKYINENPNAVANFLEFWQNGYGYLSPEWTIGTVANLDFLIILVVIFLTLYISLATNRDKQQRSIRSESFNLERLALALEVRDFLHDKRRITTVTMNQSMATAIQNLQNATFELDSAAQRISHEQK
jgi:hypothetical protein